MSEYPSAAEVIEGALQAAEFKALKSGAVPGYSLMSGAVLDALKEAGYGVVKLPEPDQDDEDGIGWGYEPLTDWGVFVSRDIVDGRVYDQNGGVKPADARLIASWWLAAAAAVSQGGEK